MRASKTTPTRPKVSQIKSSSLLPYQGLLILRGFGDLCGGMYATSAVIRFKLPTYSLPCFVSAFRVVIFSGRARRSQTRGECVATTAVSWSITGSRLNLDQKVETRAASIE